MWFSIPSSGLAGVRTLLHVVWFGFISWPHVWTADSCRLLVVLHQSHIWYLFLRNVCDTATYTKWCNRMYRGYTTFSISVLWLSLVTIRLASIAPHIIAASTEANYTTHIPQKILLEPELYPNTVRQAKLFLRQVTKWLLHVTDWGFFTINSSAVGTIMCSVATYLFILLQF